jgi:carboxypeptidase Taq
VNPQLEELKNALAEVEDLAAATNVLFWDQLTYMPPGGGPARARQQATLGRLVHEKFTAPAIGKLLDELKPYEESLPYDSDEASLIRVTRRRYERRVQVPAALVAKIISHQTETYQVWTEARPANDFARVRPYLEKNLDLSHQYAECFAERAHIADPLIADSDFGMDVATIRPLFSELRAQLLPLVQAIAEHPAADDACLRQNFGHDAQWSFGLEMAKRFGYDMQRGRQDGTPHPFTISFSIGDVRITTHLYEDNLASGLFSTLHEAGHGMYEQGIAPGFEATPLAHGTSSGVHESQSRLWENVVGRGRGCWEYFYPQLQATFPQQLGSVPLDTFYRAINKVERSLIRTDADEVTYNLHVMLRFDLELALLEGKLAIRDLPDAWRGRFKSDFGIAPPDDRDGVMQDVHWYDGFIGGAFQGYTLGNIMSGCWFEAALQAQPQIPDEIRHGQYGALHEWLSQNIYRHGAKFTAAELIQRVTGGPLTIEPYLRYLRTKYGEMYRLT